MPKARCGAKAWIGQTVHASLAHVALAAGRIVRVDYDVNLNPVTPPGKYRLVIDLPETKEQAACGEVEVTR